MILCCGEALIDMLPRVTEAGENTYMPDPGGAVHNTAVALGRLGAKTGFFSGMSSDPFGQLLRDKLDECGVDHSMSITSNRPTTLAFVKLTDGHATYFFYDENTAGRMIAQDELPKVDADALFFGGISLVVEPCGATYEALMLREAAAGKLVMVDPNIRPSFITDEAAYRGRLGRMLQRADVIKTSDEDLDWIGGSVESLLDGTDTQVVLLTRGSEGVSVVTRDGSFDVPAQKATVVDTVGAGDTFNGGFLAGLDRAGALSKSGLAGASEETLRAAASLGAQAAAITVSRAGANPPWAHEL